MSGKIEYGGPIMVLGWIHKNVSWPAAVLACFVLSVAPYPIGAAHLPEKLGMLWRGELVEAMDWFDLVFHGWVWGVLVLKGLGALRRP